MKIENLNERLSEYYGNIGDKVTLELTLVGQYYYMSQFAPRGYSPLEHTIYKMLDDEGNIFIWDTASSFLGFRYTDGPDGNDVYEVVERGDKFLLSATIKAHKEYKGDKQTILTRCHLIDIIEVPVKLTKEEIEAQKREEIVDSLNNGDKICSLGYKQYKEQFENCERVPGSFRRVGGYAFISVVLRNGAELPEKVNNKKASDFNFKDEEGRQVTYYANNNEFAQNSISADFPEHEWKLI